MTVRDVNAGVILEEVQKLKYEGYRLMQICATRAELEDAAGTPAGDADQTAAKIPAYELLYTFGMGLRMVHLKVTMRQTEEIASITSVYPCAFLYENEMHDLFGVTIRMINLDYRGNLYRTAVKTPFK
ncbi:MAG: NADH-quinone oxidoreductase subunit C [Lachnospiraceae bacterium]|nr:NADH-quinone oxidoreductase subunit C [Lachnospiraceae bacterium]